MADLIDRQAAIDAIEFGITYAKAINKETGEVKELFQASNDELRKAEDRIKQLPSAQPNLQPTCNQLATDCISRQAAIDFLEERLQASGYSNAALVSELNRSIGYLMKLPSAQRIGRWIEDSGTIACSECHIIWLHRRTAFCPNCGARMEVKE